MFIERLAAQSLERLEGLLARPEIALLEAEEAARVQAQRMVWKAEAAELDQAQLQDVRAHQSRMRQLDPRETDLLRQLAAVQNERATLQADHQSRMLHLSSRRDRLVANIERTSPIAVPALEAFVAEMTEALHATDGRLIEHSSRPDPLTDRSTVTSNSESLRARVAALVAAIAAGRALRSEVLETAQLQQRLDAIRAALPELVDQLSIPDPRVQTIPSRRSAWLEA
jgi:hypothetical protein